jgi:hypothetical protein
MSEANHHDDVQLYAGDDWTIRGMLFDEQGNPLDLTDATFTWVLIDADGQPSPASDAASIEAVEPPTAGLIIITVPDTATTGLAPGRYTDALRVHDGAGEHSTMWTGRVLVSADLFA